MKSFTLVSGFLFGLISQNSAAITRLAEPSAGLKVVFHGALGDSATPVTWSSSSLEMQARMEEGERLALQPPPKMLESPLSAKDEESFFGPKDSLGPSKSELVQHLDVESEQYKMMRLARARILKGAGGGGGHGGGEGGGGSGGHEVASGRPNDKSDAAGTVTSTACGGGSGSGAADATFSTKLTWVLLAGNLAYLRRLFDHARF
ncbi:uncharacterized protein MELLADRAFT_107357 [Melampsora larici-populina 98AG31]|uniref:Secreted protein n=1 Tax=Melampsora larici-populina (strain 98AG31 / pathotype 3-4-7) TaxID=747676 RepID=F4RPI9_MELLP|nr:uncharacterized protein MELLADRAFT_107357 [Melampsora larici-populina 98AG31]EGG05538.1 secreted protein [Melampsora larici-populina 98AG31]